MTDREAMKMALEALENLTTYAYRPSNIFRYYYPSATGNYVELLEFREKSTPAIEALRQALAQPEFDTPESHIVKWSIPVDPNNFGEALAQQALDKKATNARELGLDYEPDHGFDRTASHMAGEYVDTAGTEQEPEIRIKALEIRVAKLENPMTIHEKQLLAGQRELLRTAPNVSTSQQNVNTSEKRVQLSDKNVHECKYPDHETWCGWRRCLYV